MERQYLPRGNPLACSHWSTGKAIHQRLAFHLDKFGGLANKLAATFATADDD